jgi:hypothetical protein
MPAKSQKNLNTAEPEIGGVGMDHSNVPNFQSGGSASAAELAIALEESQKRIAKLERDAAQRNSGDSQMGELIKALTAYLPKQPAEPMSVNAENINRTSDFQNQKATVDGRSLAEAQQTLMEFRTEEKFPISISKTIANFVGANLVVTVNGVRVSIPCDGKTYFINKSHYEHARERLAKLDLLTSNTTPQIVVMGD